MTQTSKYSADAPRVEIPSDRMAALIRAILAAKGCPPDIATQVADHLITSDWSGVESHGAWRIVQYAGYYDSGYLLAESRPTLGQNRQGAWVVDGHQAIGIPAMEMATDHVIHEARQKGIAAVAIREAGHTGRLGAFAEKGAKAGCLTIIIGGGGRKKWRLVAPHGGAKALMSTNPYSIGIPGGERGPVVMDFATSAAATGWVYGARLAGAELPDGILIDRDGTPTTDPNDYFDGGAILTAGGAKGYAMSVAAEMIAEAMLGPVKTECNWLLIALDCDRYREAPAMMETAEEILAELRDCPPANGFDRVEVPGERERDHYARAKGSPISLPSSTWNEVVRIAKGLGVDAENP